MKVTVRKIKYRLFGVGLLKKGNWTLLTCKPYNQQLLYPNIKKAREVARYLNNTL